MKLIYSLTALLAFALCWVCAVVCLPVGFVYDVLMAAIKFTGDCAREFQRAAGRSE